MTGPGGSEAEREKAPQPEQIDRKLLELLVCPLTKTSLDYDPVRQELISRAARLAFPIREGVPLMTVAAARRLDEEG
jgi:uncharacterized protein YbaR (Trm112 family)